MIHLFCCIGVDENITNLNLLYHFLNFYCLHGVDEFYVILQSHCSKKKRLAEVKEILKGFHIKEKFTWNGEYNSPELYKYMLLAINGMNKTDWMILADIDEFHNFPTPAADLLRECDAREMNCIKGQILDRIAEDGELRTIEKHISIDQQFPYGADITKELAKGNTDKIAALKPPLITGPGHHHIIKKKWRAKYWGQVIDTHHFKWDSLVFNRMKSRHRYYRERKIDWYDESERVYHYLSRYERFLPEHFSFKKVDSLYYPHAEER